jgi:metal-responsive CopG/Arc/MetJ family transcriptional regulator
MVKRRRPEPQRVAIPMPAPLISRIDEYRWRERIPSRAAAIRALIEAGLKHQGSPRPAKPRSDP